MKAAVITSADGSFELPGGYVCRVVAGANGSTLPFPLVGVVNDVQSRPFVLLDTGPHPMVLTAESRPFPSTIKFPAGTVPNSTKIAYYVAETEFEAKYLSSSGLQIAVDGSGRLVVIGAGAAGAAYVGNPVLIAGGDGASARILLTDATGKQLVTATPADPTKVSYEANSILSSATNQLIALFSATKKIRLRSWWLEWPGKQTAAAKAAIQIGIATGYTSGGVDSSGGIRQLEASDAAATAIVRDGGSVVVAGLAAKLSGLPFILPAADGAWNPRQVGYDYDNSGNSGTEKPFIVPAGTLIVWRWGTAPGAGYDNTAQLYFKWSEE